MATAADVVTLDRLKRELSIPLTISADDELLTEQRAAAVSYCELVTGLAVADMDAADVPPVFSQATVACTRLLYDSIMDWPSQRALFAMLAPLRVARVATA